MTHHLITMTTSDADSASYGITYRSRHVYRTSKSHAPTRLVEWSNVNRPNVSSSRRQGRYLDPDNRATDEPVTWLLSPEATGICADPRMNTGQPGSGQVYADGVVLRDEDTATLLYRDHRTREVTLRFPPHQNGHGHATEGITACG